MDGLVFRIMGLRRLLRLDQLLDMLFAHERERGLGKKGKLTF